MATFKRRSALLMMLSAVFAPLARVLGAAQPTAETPAETPVTLPKDVVWETNNDDPLIGSEKAIQGGTNNVALLAYPLTLRVMGPNSSDYFANWNQQFTVAFTLVQRHPVTDKFIPMMATHWSVQSDQKTVFFKLDPDARFSDGHPVTADDYVFTWKAMLSDFVLDPTLKTFAQQYLESVDKIDDYTLRVVGTRPSWRALADYGAIWPTPAHATVLDKDWIERTNNQPPIAPGPYVISDMVRGELVTFSRVPNWWGDRKRYFIGQYNFDKIHILIIPPERELDYLRQGQLDYMDELSARIWNEGYNFPAVENGWVRRARVFVDMPQGIYGLNLNMKAPLFQDRNVRLALQYLFNFDRLNRDLMYNEYYRKVSFFDGTEYANPDLKAYPFDPSKALALMEQAGYRRPSSGPGLWASTGNVIRGLLFTRTETDDILVNDKGERASFTLIYDQKAFERHLTVIQQDFRRAGVDMQLQLLEPGTLAERQLQKKFEAVLVGMTSGFYPDPRQYLSSEFADTTNNNNMWGFASPEVDDLIKVYEENLDFDARRKAMYRIDQIVHDEAFYIACWDAPYLRMVYWDYFQFPDFFFPKRTLQPTDWMVYWIDPKKKAALEEAMRNNTPYPVDKDIDKDFYGVRKKFQ